MSEPLVVAIMLTRDRPEMAARAVRAFREQTYQNKRLYVYDTGLTPCTDSLPDGFPDFNIVYHRGLRKDESIGALRNLANWWGVRASSGNSPDADIIIHFDDDDVSHPNRITEQVAHLQSSGADVVGYSELLFWREPRKAGELAASVLPGEAWLFKNAVQPPGTSLCFWRRTWERKPFSDTSEAEDRKFCMGLNVAAVSSLGHPLGAPNYSPDPRLIASIHGSNTADYDLEGIIARGGGTNWRRVPEWDSYCQERMKL